MPKSEASRTIIVGDIHGCFDELVDLLDKVDLRPEDLLVSVGDLVDRGPSPGEVVAFFRDRPNSIAVMGNHERKHVRAVFSYSQEITRLQLGTRYAEAIGWMSTLPYYFENDHVRVVHAGMVPGIPLAEQKEEILCGSTSGERELSALFPTGYWHDHYTHSKPIVFGHHVVGREPMVRSGKVFGLDTGACHGGTLTALCVPSFTVHSVKARADHWSAAKRRWQLPVLKTKPWRDFDWAKLTGEITRFANTSDAAAREWLDALAAWASDVRSQYPALIDAAYCVVDELSDGFTDAARQHPAAAFLFQAKSGRLDEAGLARQCTTPGRTIDLAAALGVTMPEPPV